MEDKSKQSITIRSSAAEYLTFVASTGGQASSYEMRYEDENIWLTQKMMAALYDVSIPAVNQHLKRIFSDGELTEEAVVKKYLITAGDGTFPSKMRCKSLKYIQFSCTFASSFVAEFLSIRSRRFNQSFPKVGNHGGCGYEVG